MENTETKEGWFEPKPGFALFKYGNVFTFNFNHEFAQRLHTILTDCHKDFKLQEPVLQFFQNLNYFMDLPSGNDDEHDTFIMVRFHHVYMVTCERDLAHSLNKVLTQFLVQKRVSPASWCFAKQLEGALYPNRVDTKPRYADE